MEETIEQAALVYAEQIRGLNHKKTAKRDFMEGAKFIAEQNRWISMSEKKPPLNEDVLIKKEGCWINIGRMIDLADYEIRRSEKAKTDIRLISGNSVRDWDATHWRKIC